jgi:hypothetical protein
VTFDGGRMMKAFFLASRGVDIIPFKRRREFRERF